MLLRYDDDDDDDDDEIAPIYSCAAVDSASRLLISIHRANYSDN